jgi:hypothetical protein
MYTDGKNTAGDVVNKDRRVVKVRETARRGQRRSRHLDAVPCTKEKDFGKYESKPMLLI